MIDVRTQIPRADWSIGSFSPKTSVTVHWNGPPVDDTADPLAVIRADAQFHIDKNWGTAANPAYGDGIMYHRLYARDGRVFWTRDDDAVLYHCADANGNANSFAWQVMTGTGQSATPAQIASLKRDLAGIGLTGKGHRDWSLTTCPGDELYALIHEEVPVTDAEFMEKYNRLVQPGVGQTLEAMKAAYNPLVAHTHDTSASKTSLPKQP